MDINKLLFVIPLLLLCSCSNDKEESLTPTTNEVKFQLSTDNVILKYGGEESVYVQGANATECDIAIDDNYVTSVSASKNALNIFAKKVGKTDIYVSYRQSKEKISVKITPTLNLFGEPYIGFGSEYEEIKTTIDASSQNLLDNYIYKYDKEPRHPISFHYRFIDNKLDYVSSTIIVRKNDPDYEIYPDYMKEYADLDDIYYSSKFKGNIYIYKRNKDYYIGLREIGQTNDTGWYVYYMKTKEDIIKKMDRSATFVL